MAGQIGIKSESVWGTAVVVDTFVPVLDAKFSIDEGYMRPKGIRAGRRTQNPATLGERKVTGTTMFELPPVSSSVLLKHFFGAVSTTGAGPYTHTFTPGAHLAKSFTQQLGISDATDTIRAFTASGCKINNAEISAAIGEYAKASYDWTARDVVTATALATASYTAGLTPFTYVQGSITVNGAAVASARKMSLKITKALNDTRFVLGSRNIKEQLEVERFIYQTEITADFDDLTIFALGVAATQVACIHTYSDGTNTLTITTSGQVVGDPPSLTSNGLEEQVIRLDHSHATADASAITAVLVTTDPLAV